MFKGTPLDNANRLLQHWSKRLEAAERSGVSGRAGDYPSKKWRDIEIAGCRGAIQALIDVTQETYVHDVPAVISVEECEFCGDPATRVEQFDQPVHVCDACSAEKD